MRGDGFSMTQASTKKTFRRHHDDAIDGLPSAHHQVMTSIIHHVISDVLLHPLLYRPTPESVPI
jgi:hypothetical protein